MKKGLLIIFFIIGIIIPVSFASAGTVLSQYKYAWSSGVGYINFENVIVNDSTISGYAWSEKSGWIKFNPAQGGVYNDGNGHLSGFAWGEGLGWIDFSGVTISTTTGKFSGTATGELVGTINFNCPNYCDVRTDWRVVVVNPPVPEPAPSRGGSSGSFVGFFGNSLHVDSSNEPLVIFPVQSGTLRKDLSAGVATLDVSSNNILKRTIFIIDELGLNKSNEYLVPQENNLINKAFYNIYAIDEVGVLVHSFNHPIKVVLPLAEEKISYKDFGLYWLNETNWEWVNIPDAVFTDDSVTFSVNHLTKFAVFAPINASSSEEMDDMVLGLPAKNKNQYINSEKGKMTNISSSTKNIIANDENKKVVAQRTNGALVLIGIIVVGIIILVLKRRREDKCNE